MGADQTILVERGESACDAGKGPYLYDICTGWEEGVPKKQTKGTKSADLSVTWGVKKSENFADVI